MLEEAIFINQEQGFAGSPMMVASAASDAPLIHHLEKPKNSTRYSLLHRKLFQVVPTRVKG